MNTPFEFIKRGNRIYTLCYVINNIIASGKHIKIYSKLKSVKYYHNAYYSLAIIEIKNV